MHGLMMYVIGIIVSALLHVSVVSALWITWEEPNQKVYVQPQFISAQLIKLAPEIPKKLSASEKASRSEPTKTNKKKLEPNKHEEQKVKEEQEKRKEEKRRLAAEEKRLREERAAIERQTQQAEWEDTLARAEAELDAQEDERAANSYRQVIQQRLSENWSRPPSARRGMEAQVRIRLVPTGQVVGLTIIKSSGDTAFDRSVEQAVRKVDRFEELQTMDGRLFELKFRSVDVAFSPEDLRL